MKRLFVVIFFLLFIVDGVYGQFNQAKRCPSRGEIEKAKQELLTSLKTLNYEEPYGFRHPHNITDEAIILHDTKIGSRDAHPYQLTYVYLMSESKIDFVPYVLVDRTDDYGRFIKFEFSGGIISFRLLKSYYNISLKEAESKFIKYMMEDGDTDFGFHPDCNQDSTSSNSDYQSGNNNEDNSTLWTVIIGALTAVALLGIRNRRKKLKAKKENSPEKDKKKSDKKQENVDYVLQLNKKEFSLNLHESQTLEAKVWKITEKGKSLVNATIRVQTPDKALKIMPFSATGTLNSQLTLQKTPTNAQFNISVTARAEGKTYQQNVKITTGNRLIIETAPDNIRNIRPNLDQNLTCFAQVVDENDEPILELTKKIKFDNSKEPWIDLLKDGPYLDEGWAAMLVGASDPKENYDISHPPKSVTLGISVEYKEKNKEIRLENNLTLNLLDCKLETDLEQVTFPATKKQSEITFKANIEDCDGSKSWKFKAVYMKDFDTVDEKPLTKINIDDVKDTEVKITLTGPILLPKEDEQFIRKLFVVSAQQEEETALERHIYVMVSREGLFIEKGINKNNEIEILATKDVKEEIEFALYRYDAIEDQIIKDEQGLENLTFELTSTDKKEINVESVLKPQFSFRALVNNAYYTLITEEEIPGTGELIELKYRVSAPISKDAKKPEVFIKEFTLKVKTLDIGRRIPTWQEAYDDCRYVIFDYVPEGPERVKLYEILEERKELLDAEGLVELRKRIWKVASNLILAEGAEGYKDVDAWASGIEETLKWAEWAGDLAFNALVSFYMARYGKAGAVGGVALNLAKSSVIDGINFYIYEDLPVEVFIDREYQKIVPLLMNVAKGRLISVENIEMFVTKNKVLAWTIFIACEFTYNLYRTKSLIKAAKETARQLRDELIIRKVTGHLHKNAARYKINDTDVETVIKDVEKYVKGTKGSKYVDKAKVLEIMKDPAKVRTLKNHAPDWLKRAFDKTRTKIYKEHDAKLIKHIAKKYHLKPGDIEIDDFRTPGSADGKYNLNTDRDYRVLRTVKTNSGKLIKIEIHRDRWLPHSYEEFGKLTGKPSTVSAKDWAELHQQRGTDRYDAEASADYSDHFYDPEIGEIIKTKPNILKAENGEGPLYNAKSLGKMYENKVKNALQPGAIPEAYAQAKKGVHTLKKVIKGYKKMNLDTPKISDNLQDAMKIIEKMNTDVRTKSKHITEATTKLKKLGYKDVGDVIQDVSNKFKDLSKHDAHLSYKRIYK